MSKIGSNPEVLAIDSRTEYGMQMLLEAYDYARDLNHDLWDFSIEHKALLEAGLTVNDLRWLLCNHYARHAFETTIQGDSRRSFRFQEHMSLNKRSCCTLTEEGAEFLRMSFNQRQDDGTKTAAACWLADVEDRPSIDRTNNDDPLTPIWDCDQHELRFGPQVVKQFRLPCPNQTTILSAFQEEGWPRRIDDPLPPRDEVDSKRRLHDTIKSLNRKQHVQRIRFRGDGTGEGVLWESTANNSQAAAG